MMEIYADQEKYYFRLGNKTFEIKKENLLDALHKLEDDLESLNNEHGIVKLNLEPDSQFAKTIKKLNTTRYRNVAQVDKLYRIRLPGKLARLLNLKPGDKVLVKPAVDMVTPVLVIAKLRVRG